MCAEMTYVDVHIDMTIYRIAENFQGRKLGLWWLYAKPQNLGCCVLWHEIFRYIFRKKLRAFPCPYVEDYTNLEYRDFFESAMI